MLNALAKYVLGIVFAAACVAVLAHGLFGDAAAPLWRALGVVSLMLGGAR